MRRDAPVAVFVCVAAIDMRAGGWRDNMFIERLMKSVKYEEVYLHAYDSVAAARDGIAKYSTFYNGRRPHTALDRTPDAAYFESQPLAVAS
jgi:putative transposase